MKYAERVNLEIDQNFSFELSNISLIDDDTEDVNENESDLLTGDKITITCLWNLSMDLDSEENLDCLFEEIMNMSLLNDITNIGILRRLEPIHGNDKMRQIVRPFVSLLEGDYKDSLVSFQEIELNSMKSYHITSIYLFISICHLNTLTNSDQLDELLYELVQHEIPKDKYYLSAYFKVIGLLYLSKYEVEELIRKFILSTTLSPSAQNFHYLLISLLLFGGLNVKLIWFFNFMKDYSFLNNHTNTPITSVFMSSSINLLDPLLKELCALERNYSESLKDISEFYPGLFACPFIKLTPEGYEFITVEKENKTVEFMKFWLECYACYKGVLPDAIKKYLLYLELI